MTTIKTYEHQHQQELPHVANDLCNGGATHDDNFKVIFRLKIKQLQAENSNERTRIYLERTSSPKLDALASR